MPRMRQTGLRPTQSRSITIPSNQFMTTRKSAVCHRAVLKSAARFQNVRIAASAASMMRQNGIMKRLLCRATVSFSASPRRKASS